MQYNTSSAYDLSVYQPVSAEPQKKQAAQPKLKVVQRKSAKQTLSFVFTPRVLGAFAIIVTLISLMVYNQVCLNELSGQINSINRELTKMDSEYVKMSSELEAMVSMQTVAEKATNELGLQRLDKYQTQYITLYGQDKGVLSEEAVSKEEGTNNVLLTVERFIHGVKEYIGDR